MRRRKRLSWDTVESFKKTAQVHTAMGVKYSKYDSMNLFELRDALFMDSDSKTKGFTTMNNAVNDLLSLSVSKGKYFDEEGTGMTKDFFEALFTATSSVNQYLATHVGFRWRDKGDRRVQIATRISYLLKDLSDEIR